MRKHSADLQTAAAALVLAFIERGGGGGGMEEPAMALTDACAALGACTGVRWCVCVREGESEWKSGSHF